MSRRKQHLILTVRNEDTGNCLEEKHDPRSLTDPESVGRRRALASVSVRTEVEAETWARQRLAAYNRTRRPGDAARVFVSVNFVDWTDSETMQAKRDRAAKLLLKAMAKRDRAETALVDACDSMRRHEAELVALDKALEGESARTGALAAGGVRDGC